MLGQYFYNQSTRNVVVAFGTLFNTIQLHKKDGSGNIVQSMKVPLAYGPKQKWLSRLTEDPNFSKKVAVTLPRIGFEISGIAYDPARKLQKTVKVKKVADGVDNEQVKSGFMPVPYNINFDLYVLSKNSDDALQIVEQILPFFQPDYTVTMKEVPELDIIRDVPIILNSVGYEDDYDQDYELTLWLADIDNETDCVNWGYYWDKANSACGTEWVDNSGAETTTTTSGEIINYTTGEITQTTVTTDGVTGATSSSTATGRFTTGGNDDDATASTSGDYTIINRTHGGHTAYVSAETDESADVQIVQDSETQNITLGTDSTKPYITIIQTD